MEASLRAEVQRLVRDLACGRYAEIVADRRVGRLQEDELRSAVEDYGRTLVELPDEAWASVDEYPISGETDACALDVPLWTTEEGRSDLTLSLTATRRGEGYVLVIDDLHVL